MKNVKFIGFWDEDFKELVRHLQATNYPNVEELNRLLLLTEESNAIVS